MYDERDDMAHRATDNGSPSPVGNGYLPVREAGRIHDLVQELRKQTASKEEAHAQVQQEKERGRAENAELARLMTERAGELSNERNEVRSLRERVCGLIAEEAARCEEHGRQERDRQVTELRQKRDERRAAFDTYEREQDAERKRLRQAVRASEPAPIPALRPEDIAAENGYILTESDRVPVPSVMLWLITLASSLAVGFSFGIAVKLIHVDTLRRELLQIILCCAFGTAASVALKYALESLWGEFSTRLHGDRPWKASLTVALFLTLLATAVYSTVERAGLLNSLLLDTVIGNLRGSPGGNTPDPAQQWMATIASAFITLPYILLCCTNGFRKARYETFHRRASAIVNARIGAQQERMAADRARRNELAEPYGVTCPKQALEDFTADAEATKRAHLEELADLDRKIEALRALPLEDSARLKELRRQLEQAEAELKQLDLRIQETLQRAETIKNTEPEAPSQGRLNAAEAQVKRLEAEILRAREEAHEREDRRQGKVWDAKPRFRLWEP